MLSFGRVSLLVLVVSGSFVWSTQAAAGRGGAITRGGGGVQGAQRPSNEDERIGSLNVILVVILPVAQMILVLVLLILLRLCYRRWIWRKRQLQQHVQMLRKMSSRSDAEIHPDISWTQHRIAPTAESIKSVIDSNASKFIVIS